MSKTVHRVPVSLLGDFLPLVRDWIEGAVAYHEFMDADDVALLLRNSACQLFIVTEAQSILGFAIMEMIHYPSQRVANVMLSGGDRGFVDTAVQILLPELQKWGEEQDAHRFAILGARPGWVRALREKGFSQATHVTLWTDYDVEGRRIKRQHAEANEHIRAVGGGTAVH